MLDYNEIFTKNTNITKDGQNSFSVVTNPIRELDKSDEVWADIIFDSVCSSDVKEQDGYYSLKDVQSAVKRLSNFLSETTVNIINDQINDIYFAANSLSTGEGKMLYCIYPGKRETADEMLRSIDVTKRNFIAHAGFLKEIVKVKRASEKEVLVKYHFEDEKYYEVLRKIYNVDVKKFL